MTNQLIKLTSAQWSQVCNQNTLNINTDGFKVSVHTEWDAIDNNYISYPVKVIHLDFYDDHKKLMFLLKYHEIINPQD